MEDQDMHDSSDISITDEVTSDLDLIGKKTDGKGYIEQDT